MSTLDIILPVYGVPELTWRCLTHLQLFGLPDQRIIMVDDACPEGSEGFKDYLEERGHVYIRHAENIGCHGAWNTGLQLADAENVLFVNNDIAILPGCLAAMAKSIAAGHRYVGAREIRGGWRPLQMLEVMREHTAPGTAKQDYFNSCFMMPRQLVVDVGAFDERFKVVYGDIDFLIRYRNKGYYTVVIGDAWAYHASSASRRKMLGVEGDVQHHKKDRALFEEKWADRPDILMLHPSETEEEMRSNRESLWAKAEDV